MKLVNDDMSINLIPFQTQSGTWKIIGTESLGPGLSKCIDEMRNTTTGEYITRTRLQLFRLQEEGKIKPL